MASMLFIGLAFGFASLFNGLSGFSLRDPDNEQHQTFPAFVQLQQLVSREQNRTNVLDTKVTELQSQLSSLNTTVLGLQNSINNHLGTGAGGQSDAIAFEGMLGSDSTNLMKNETITFREIITSEGDPYDINTGIFHCKTSGVYLFAMTLLTDGSRNYGGTAEMYLKSGNRYTLIAKPQTGPASGYVGTGEVAVVIAYAGDEVTVIYTGPATAYISKFTRFSGVLIQKWS